MEPYIRNGLTAIDMFDADPFRNGTDCCCAVHTCAGRYKRALNAIRDGGGDAGCTDADGDGGEHDDGGSFDGKQPRNGEVRHQGRE